MSHPVDIANDPEALEYYFGLSYASWLVMPRVFMAAMPEEWRIKMAELLHEFDDSWEWPPELGQWIVSHKVDGRFAPIPEWMSQYRHPDRATIESMRRVPLPLQP
jgi:hypothetical protein